MAIKKVLQVIAGVISQYTALDSSAGAGSAGNLVALDGAGLVALNMMPAGVGPDVLNYATKETLTAGMFVNIVDVTGTAQVQKADKTDATKPAVGFVLAGATAPDPLDVYFFGSNNLVPVGTFVAADVGKKIFLSTAGTCTLTAPLSTDAGALMQCLGRLTAVGATYATVMFEHDDGITM